MTSKGIGYIHTTLNREESYIDWKWLDKQKTEKQTKYVKHIKLPAPLTIKIDGRPGRALILKPS